MDKIRVLLADDHTIVRKGLRSLLDNEPGIEVVGEADDGREAVQQVEDLQPDIVVMDIAMPSLNGLEATRLIKQRSPETKVLILTMHADEEYVHQLLRAGVSGYLVKKAAPTELVTAIRAAWQGESFLSPSISRQVIDEYILRAGGAKEEEDSFDKLTNREREVLQLLAEGHSNRQVAEILSISVKTVETHKSNLMDKLDIQNITELIKYAIRKGVIRLND